VLWFVCVCVSECVYVCDLAILNHRSGLIARMNLSCPESTGIARGRKRYRQTDGGENTCEFACLVRAVNEWTKAFYKSRLKQKHALDWLGFVESALSVSWSMPRHRGRLKQEKGCRMYSVHWQALLVVRSWGALSDTPLFYSTEAGADWSRNMPEASAWFLHATIELNSKNDTWGRDSACQRTN
jgi:hypothetical protein